MPRSVRQQVQVVDVLAAPAPQTTGPDTDDAPGPDPEPIIDPPVPAPQPPLPPLPDPLPDPLRPPVPRSVQATRPVPESELSPEQRRIRDLEDQLAKERGRKDPDPELEPPANPGAAGNILIHFLEDGFTALGKVWYRGQELEFEPDGQAYADTKDRNGRSWLDLRGDEFGQVERWGKVMFRVGPWPGKALTDAAKVPYEALRPLKGEGSTSAPTEAELETAARAEAARRRAAPRLPVR